MSTATQSPGRTLPNSVESEEYVLSCCLMDGSDSIAKCINAGLTPASFFTSANAIIFDRMVETFRRDGKVAIEVMAEEMRVDGTLKQCGGMPYLLQVSSRVPTTAQVDFFITRIAQLHAMRQAIRIGSTLVEQCYVNQGDNPADIIGEPLRQLMELSSGALEQAEPSWDQVVAQAEEDLKARIAHAGIPKDVAIEFPWPGMDQAFQPMQRQQLVVIAARPSVGKSSLARPIAARAAQHGHKIYFVTLEVNPRNVPLQIAAASSRVGLRGLPKAHKADQAEIMEALRSLKGLGITISSKDRTMARIAARARALKARGMLDMLVVDHGGLVLEIANASKDEKTAVVGRFTKLLKALAQDLNIVCVMLWQLNRESAKDGNREPRMEDLKDCGSIEEDADKVLMIHRPNEDPLKNSPQRLTDDPRDTPRFYQNVIQVKGRDDGTASLAFYFDRATASFDPATREARAA